MFNYVHGRDRRGGIMPWMSLDWRWSATFPNDGDFNDGVASLHDKFWGQGVEMGRTRWDEKRADMERWAVGLGVP